MKIIALTIAAAASGAAIHFVPDPWGAILAAALTNVFAHFGVTFATDKNWKGDV